MAKKAARTPRPQSLPGISSIIQELEATAASYGDVRDHRMRLLQDEVSYKGELRKLMRKHGKTIYKRAGIEIRLIEGEDDVKVKVKKTAEDAAADVPYDALDDRPDPSAREATVNARGEVETLTPAKKKGKGRRR